MSVEVRRSYNWDLLRAISMFLVVVVHSSNYLGPIGGFETQAPIGIGALVCNGIFFALSGYFALAPQKRGLKEYYINKLITVVLPILLYSILLFLYLAVTNAVRATFGGYVSVLYKALTGKWWFIPTLIPCLAAAPFLSKGLEALSDKTIRQLCIVMCSLFAVGALCLFGQWMFNKANMTTLANIAILPTTMIPPGLLGVGPTYFQLFIFGGIYRRLAPHLSKQLANRIILVGIISWILDIAFATFGVSRADPSFFWLFSTFAAFALFERVTIHGAALQRGVSWAAKRSYSIYLVQGTVIPFLADFIYTRSVFGNVASMPEITRIVFWLVLILLSYLMSLGLSSVFDVLVVAPLQRLIRQLITGPHGRARINKAES